VGADKRECSARAIRVPSIDGSQGAPSPGVGALNVEKTMSAPVTVIVAYDLKL
jgi:hypothetical protein